MVTVLPNVACLLSSICTEFILLGDVIVLLNVSCFLHSFRTEFISLGGVTVLLSALTDIQHDKQAAGMAKKQKELELYQQLLVHMIQWMHG